MPIYFTDVQYVYKVDAAGTVTRYVDPDQNNAYFLSSDPDGIVAWGQPQERVDPAQAAGQRLSTDLVVVDDYWGPADSGGSYTYTVASGGVMAFFDPKTGPGAAYDPVDDALWAAVDITWYPDGSQDPPDAVNYMLAKFSRDGQVLDVAVEVFPTPEVAGVSNGLFYSGGANNFRGVALAPTRRKLYVLFGLFDNAMSILEYDLSTGVSRVAQQCFDSAVPIDLCWDEARDRLWVVNRQAMSGTHVLAQAYDPDDFVFQNPATSDTQVVSVMDVVLFADVDTDDGPGSEVRSFVVAGDTIYFYTPRWSDSQSAVWKTPITEGGSGDEWELVATDSDWYTQSWDMISVVDEPVLTVRIERNRVRWSRGR